MLKRIDNVVLFSWMAFFIVFLVGSISRRPIIIDVGLPLFGLIGTVSLGIYIYRLITRKDIDNESNEQQVSESANGSNTTNE